MFGYYLELALRGLRRSGALTLLMIAAIGVGVGAFVMEPSIHTAVGAGAGTVLAVPVAYFFGRSARVPGVRRSTRRTLEPSSRVSETSADS